ncbi:hypothetical protein K523DRAFT_379558, partial [Schizophyllum commune Tattone D]
MRPTQWGDHFGVPCTQPQLARALCRAIPRASRTSRPTPLIRLFKGGDGALGILRLCARLAMCGAAEETQSRRSQARYRSLRSSR